MKRLLLLTAIFLAGCTGLIELDTNSTERTPTETVSQYVDSFNSADVPALNEITASPFFWLRGKDKNVYDKYGDSIDFQALPSIPRHHQQRLAASEKLLGYRINFKLQS
jgi:hypothetical protein